MPIIDSDYTQLLNQARVKLVGASDAGLKGELYDVVSEFVNDSSIWTQDVFLLTQVGLQEYDIFVPEGQIIRLAGVSDIGTALPAANTIPSTILPVAALMPEVGRLLLRYAAPTARVYCVTVVTNVALPTDKNMKPIAPAWLLPIWHVGLLDGLLGKMMTSPNKSYSNNERGEYHLRRFRGAIARARVSKLRANTNGAQAWRFPQQYRSNTQQGGVPSVGSGNERAF